MNVLTEFLTPVQQYHKTPDTFFYDLLRKVGSFVPLDLKSSNRSKTEVSYDMRLKISAIQPDIIRLVSSEKHHYFRH